MDSREKASSYRPLVWCGRLGKDVVLSGLTLSFISIGDEDWFGNFVLERAANLGSVCVCDGPRRMRKKLLEKGCWKNGHSRRSWISALFSKSEPRTPVRLSFVPLRRDIGCVLATQSIHSAPSFA